MARPSVTFSPTAVQQLKRGLDTLANLLGLTLGPTQGAVFSAADGKTRPELLTDAATIARRMLELPDPGENVGAMLLRNLVWRMHERLGDGGALAAVLAQALLDEMLRSVTAGANPVPVLNGMKRAARHAGERLAELSRPAGGQADLTAVVRSATGIDPLSRVLGEMFHILGPQAYIMVEDYVAPTLERVYLDGGRWAGSLASPYLVNTPATRQAVLNDVFVALYHGNLEQAEQVRPALAAAAERRSDPEKPLHLLVVAHAIRGEALNLLVAAGQGKDFKTIGVNLSRAGEKAHADLSDLALLSGATLIDPQMGRKMENFRPADLGQARRAAAGPEALLAASGQGQAAEIQRQIELLQTRLEALPFGDEGRGELEMRLGRLAGCAGVLKVGAISEVERAYLHQNAERGIKVLRGALAEGLLPGGGTAYLHTIPTLNELLAAAEGDEAAGVRAVLRALEAPFRTILKNAGVDAPGLALEQVRQAGFGYIYEAVSGQIMSAEAAGVLDSSAVLQAALQTAASGAAMALSTETVILKKNPKLSYEP